MLSQDVIENALVLWNYHCRIDQFSLDCKVERVIVGLGSYDLAVADHCADLYLQGYANKIIFSGKDGNWTSGRWQKTEAEIFADQAIAKLVSAQDILLEKFATNLGENILYSRAIIEDLLPNVGEVILVTKPNTTRRAYATFMANWSQMRVVLSAPSRKFSEVAVGYSLEDLVHELVGDVQRIINYPAKGFQIPQDVPPIVMQSFECLYSLGYRQHCQ